MHVQLSFLHGPIDRQNWITLKKKKWKEKNNDITFCVPYVKMTLITCKFEVQPFNKKSISNPFNKKIGFDPLKFKIQNMGA